MFERNYYTLVAGLKDYLLDSETKGFDAPAIIAEIKEGVSKRDRKTVELFYNYYDIENIINLRGKRVQFSELGNFTREELKEELASPSRLPKYMAGIVSAYIALEKEGTDADIDDELDTELALERNLFAAYYKECVKSGSKFLRGWAEFDQTLRNVSAAFTARKKSMPVGEVIVGESDVTASLARSSAADFGLKGEVSYIDQIMAAVSDSSNLIEKEHRIDSIRWDMADDLTSMSYFDINFLLGYLAKVNIIHRWATLDPEKGKDMLKKLIDRLTGSDVIEELRDA